MEKSPDGKRVTVSIISRGTSNYSRPESVLEGGIQEKELETTLILLASMAARLVELRAVGWHITTHQRFQEMRRVSDFPHSGEILNPLTDQVAYKFPQCISRISWGRIRKLRRVLREIQALADSPLMIQATQGMTRRLDSMQELFQEHPHDALARMAIARFPSLPVDEVLLIAEAAESLTADSTGALAAIEQAYYQRASAE